MATQTGRNWSSGDIVTAANLSSIERGVSAVAEEYTPTTWANGNTVTAAGLNNIEQGIVNASGESNFSTAEVTIINTSATSYDMECFPHINEGYIDCLPVVILLSTSLSFEVVLYQGTLVWYFDSQPPTIVVIDGNATFNEDFFTITGDCTITISDSSSDTK